MSWYRGVGVPPGKNKGGAMPEWFFAPATDSTGVFGIDQGVPVTICCWPYGGSIIVVLQVLRQCFVCQRTGVLIQAFSGLIVHHLRPVD